MWISFLPGIGLDTDPPPPSLEHLELHVKNGNVQDNPLVFVAFSISASEPRMMVLRNLVGKLMAWCNDQKIFLKPRTWQGGEEHKGIKDIKFIDMFQDEGNRIGCYALWDSFTDLVNDTDLKFIESLAEEMMNMTAESKSLDWTKNWDKERVRKHILKELKEIMNDEQKYKEYEDSMENNFKLDGKALAKLLEEDEEQKRSNPQNFDEQNDGQFETLLHVIGISVRVNCYVWRRLYSSIIGTTLSPYSFLFFSW